MDRQIESLAKLRISMAETPFSLRMLASDGTDLGLAHFNSNLRQQFGVPLLHPGEEKVRPLSNHLIPRSFLRTQEAHLGEVPTTSASATTALRVPVPPAGGSPKEPQNV